MKEGLIILASGATSSWIGADADRAFLLSLAGIIGIVWYRLKRKFKKDSPKTWKEYLDRNIVELALASVIAPGAIRIVLNLVKEIVEKI